MVKNVRIRILTISLSFGLMIETRIVWKLNHGALFATVCFHLELMEVEHIHSVDKCESILFSFALRNWWLTECEKLCP